MATILDSVTMTEITRDPSCGGDLPYVTHEGKLDVGGLTFHVYQLNDGQRIIPCEEVEGFFSAMLEDQED
jgi:hypothetical protein